MAQWGYHDNAADGECGPCSWAKEFPAACGKKQSPIDIATKAAKPKTNLPDLTISYDPSRCQKISNNGHTFTVHVEERDPNKAVNNNLAVNNNASTIEMDLSGGPLEHKYQLAQFHCHWGADDTKGAEHTIDGHRYAAEVHLVHWNTERFESVGDAISQEGGIAVLGVFIKAGKENPAWKPLTDLLREIRFKDGSFRMKKGFDPASLLPGNLKEYWTYGGSLTTPPCFESVQFILFRETVEVSPEQLQELRALSECCEKDIPKSGHDGKLVDNFRPCMPLNGRVVTASFTA